MSESNFPPILSDDRLDALRNLARKQGGSRVGWIDIAEARALTECGLAARGRSGWSITPRGNTALAGLQSILTATDRATVLAFHPR